MASVDDNGRLLVSVTTLTSSDTRRDGTVCLRVEDDVSGEVLVALEVPAAKWWSIITGGTRVVDGFIGRNLDRVGKKIRTARHLIPRDVTGYGPEGDAAAEAYVLAHLEEWGDPERWRVQRTNQGHEAVLNWWDAS